MYYGANTIIQYNKERIVGVRRYLEIQDQRLYGFSHGGKK